MYDHTTNTNKGLVVMMLEDNSNTVFGVTIIPMGSFYNVAPE